MFHHKLIELESELRAKQLVEQRIELTPDCEQLLSSVENEIGIHLGAKTLGDWQGWLSYRRKQSALVICRGRSFKTGGFFPEYKAGFDVTYGADAISEYVRGFDVTPPQDLDHLLVNFCAGQTPQLQVWYGENIAAYKLFFQAEAHYSNENALKDAIAEGCSWILTKPKQLSLEEFFLQAKGKNART